MSWLGTWEKRIKVTVSNTNIDTANLTHFPLLLTLGTSVGTGSTDVSCVFDELTSDANRKKIAITKTDGTTQLYGEIEKWDDANEKAWIWVSKSDFVLDYDATTDVYLYYDSTQDDNTTYIGDTNDVVAESVWDSNFKAVYHMADGADNAHIYDSTSNDNDGAKLSANNPIEADGDIGKAQEFSNDYINYGADASLDLTSALTIEALVKSTKNDGVLLQGIVSKANISGTEKGWALTKAANNYFYFQVARLGAATRNDFYVNSGQAYTDNDWHYLVGVLLANGSHYLYVDGVQTGYRSRSDWTPVSSGVPMVMGTGYGDYPANTAFIERFEGDVCRTALSNIARTAGWIKATHYSLIDGLVSWGSEETF